MATIVTGAAGFLGKALTELLLARGDHVVAIDRRPVSSERADGALTVLVADLLGDDERVREAFKAATSVFHLAGRPGVRDVIEAGGRWRDNVLAGSRVLALTSPGTPMLIASSSSVYGGTRRGRPSHEDDRLRPRGEYALSKAALERLCAGRQVTVVRPFTVAGEGQRPDMALHLWLAAARAHRPLRVYGSLDRTRDITDVRQVVAVMADLIGHPGVVNIGTGQGHSLREMIAAVAEATGTRPVVDVVPASVHEPADSLADTRRLADLLGWVPRTNLLDLVRRQADAGP
ncbi:NAD-dependent epimerase/dehydratase family protein [Nonomuraea sp. NPDC049655]|uniref:NAD-dependent epimerase/dehydratase family protein n=1 Tax=Nonomuraea sp. NPDC049655 TaxID=3364355 RepID=UPI003794C5AC